MLNLIGVTIAVLSFIEESKHREWQRQQSTIKE